MAADATWFTFTDGELGYDCAACGQACCRGHGFAAGADAQAHTPTSASAARPRAEREVVMTL